MEFLNIIKYKHFIKSAIVWIPFILSIKDIDLIISFKDLLIFTFLFSFINQAVYMINDYVDRKNDLLIKKENIYNKYISLGKSKKSYLNFCTLLIIIPIFYYFILPGNNKGILILLIIYIVLTTLYTVYLKKIVYLDILTLASFYGIRLIMGIEIINLYVYEFKAQIILICLASAYVVSIKRMVGFNKKLSMYSLISLKRILILTKYIFLISCSLFLLTKNVSYIFEIENIYFIKTKSLFLITTLIIFVLNYEKMLRNKDIEYDVVNNFLKKESLYLIFIFGIFYML